MTQDAYMGQRAVHEAVATALEGLEPETTMAGIRVRGHEKVPTDGQVRVPTGGQVEVPTLRSSCRSSE
jgi:hypothetical protein